MLALKRPVNWLQKQPRWVIAAIAVVGIGLVAWLLMPGRITESDMPTFAVRKGPLEINILEGGSLQALESQEIKCQVRVGREGSKILKIVEEGYLVTEEDVKNQKVLVELDSSELQEQIIQQEIQYQSALATLIDAQQNYQIQLSQNRSDVLAAEQAVRFARMDLDKFLGDSVAAQIVADSGLDRMLAAVGTNTLKSIEDLNTEQLSPAEDILPPRGTPPNVVSNSPVAMVPAVLRTINISATHERSITQAVAEATEPPQQDGPVFQIAPIDFSKYSDIQALGDGEAKQKLRKFEDDLQVSRKELGQSGTMLEGTKRLAEKGFVTRNDLQRDELSYENSRLKVQTAETARDLFIKYDFLKQAEEWLSKYVDSVRGLDKAKRLAVSKQAQAMARLRSARGQHEVQAKQRAELRDQMGKCIMVAQKSGLVVYGGGRDEYYGGEERIREGATVRERQSIITIPDMSQMSVSVKVHESYIKKVRRGQRARITVDAYAEKVLTGEVSKVAVLPDSQNRWMNPDMKIYNTTVTIDGSHDWVKPGMSAKVEILVSEIPDCLYVPLQAVSMLGDKQVCYVQKSGRVEVREVTLGDYNDDFIVIRSGLSQGERVCLRPPGGVQTEPMKPDNHSPEPPQEQQPTSVASKS